jgi:two-component system CheB/CheR fusion protein
MDNSRPDDIKREQFLSIVSHELKTPITSIQGFSQALQRKIEQKLKNYVENPLFTEAELQKHQEHLEMINRQIKRLTRLIDDLLDVSVLENGTLGFNWTTIDLAQHLHDVIARLQVYSNHNIELNCDVSKEYCVLADETRLEKLFSNLIANAIKYSPDSDTIVVSLSEKDSSYVVSIRDFGVGISPEDSTHIFDLYFQGSHVDNKKSSGLGLGLFLSKQIAELHRGAITFDSELGKGSTFYVELPKVEETS